MIDRRLFIALSVFLSIAAFFAFAYKPSYFVNGMKVFDPLYTQGDVAIYINWFRKEIEDRSFFDWYLRLDLTNPSLVYFSWLQGVIYQNKMNELLATAVIFVLIFSICSAVLKSGKKHSTFTSFSLVTSMSMIICMQTVTKEVMVSFFLFLAFFGVFKKNFKIVIVSVFFLSLVRVYFAFILLCAIVLYVCFKHVGKKAATILAAVFLLLLPCLYINVFTIFLSTPNSVPTMSISNFYAASLPYPGMLFVWLPFRIFQNLAEPFLALYRIHPTSYIIYISTVLDVLTSTAMMFSLIFLWRLRLQAFKATGFVVFLIIFSGVYAAVIGSFPLVHFRYLMPLLPVLGLTIDFLRTNPAFEDIKNKDSL
jgi:hypothetical protein